MRLTAELGEPLHVEADAVERPLEPRRQRREYCPTGSSIRVTAREAIGRVELVVADTGPGIAPEHLARVFERFRVDAGPFARGTGGTGLGLSIVKHMVEAMRGKVSVASTVGKGSTFTVSLASVVRAEVAARGRGSAPSA